MSAELYHSCVEKLYQIALEPQGSPIFLDKFCRLIDAVFAHYNGPGLGSVYSRCSLSHRLVSQSQD